MSVVGWLLFISFGSNLDLFWALFSVVIYQTVLVGDGVNLLSQLLVYVPFPICHNPANFT